MPDYKVPVITGSELVVGDLLRWDGSNWVNYPDSNYAGSPILAGLTVTGNSVLGLNSAVFQPTADATGFFQVKDQDGNAFITGDSVANTLIANGAIINGTIATGLDMSGGTFADYSIALPTDPKMSAGGTQFMYVDDTAKNFGLGRDIFSAITIGTYNMCLGDAAGTSITEANYCFLAGARAGAKITTADSCVGIGTNALFEKISGNAVVAIGNNAAYSVTTTGNIIAIGPNAARYHTNGNMTAIGVSAAESHEGYYNVMVGQQAGMHGTGSYGTYVGHQAGYSSDTSAPYGDADAITAIGAFAGTGISTADNCTYIGAYAGRYQTTIGNRVIVDGLDRTNAANEITDTLMYGILAATPASQSLRINAGTFILGNPTHSDAEGGGAVLIQGTREDGAGTPTIAGQISISHDGTGANDQLGKIIESVNTGAGLVESRRVNSDLSQTFAGDVIIGAAGNLEKVTNDLTLTTAANKTLVMSQSVYDDLQFQVSNAKVTPNNLLPSWEAFTTNTSEYAFAIDEEVDTQANELPHWWKEGTAGHAHIHITTKAVPAQEQKARFTVTFAYADTGEVWVEAPLTAELTIPISTTALTNFYLDLGDLTLTNYLVGAQIRCRIKRVAKSAGGTEYVGDIFITQVGIHLEKTRLGSRNETTS